MVFNETQMKKAFLLFREGYDYKYVTTYFKNKKNKISESKKIDLIIKAVITHLDIPEDVFKSKYRGRKVVDARAIYYYLSKAFTNKSYYYIGEKVNRDHASAIHGFNQLVDLVDIGDKKLKKQLSEVKKLYNAYIREVK
tara:strand:+ start:304 stop:720 length:417 start_codon:yes stop_codon:yes gene_type:complete